MGVTSANRRNPTGVSTPADALGATKRMSEYESDLESDNGAKYENTRRDCARLDCSEPTPVDMPAVAIDGDTYCSPDCARTALNAVRGHPDEIPAEIALLDPQNHVDKSPLPDVSTDQMVIERRVVGLPDAFRAVDEIEEMYPGKFRVSVDT